MDSSHIYIYRSGYGNKVFVYTADYVQNLLVAHKFIESRYIIESPITQKSALSYGFVAIP